MRRLDRYEFASVVIGEGSEEMIREIFNNNEHYEELVGQETGQFEDVLASKMSEMTIEELTILARKYDYDFIAHELVKY